MGVHGQPQCNTRASLTPTSGTERGGRFIARSGVHRSPVQSFGCLIHPMQNCVDVICTNAVLRSGPGCRLTQLPASYPKPWLESPPDTSAGVLLRADTCPPWIARNGCFLLDGRGALARDGAVLLWCAQMRRSRVLAWHVASGWPTCGSTSILCAFFLLASALFCVVPRGRMTPIQPARVERH